MAWTTPVDWSVGQMLAAADLNKVNANLNALKSPPYTIRKGNGSGNITLTSATYADVLTGLNINFTTNGGPIMIGFTGLFSPVSGATLSLDVFVDGTQLGTGSLFYSGNFWPMSFTVFTDALTAGQDHTFVLRAKTVGQNTILYNNSACVPIFWAREVS